MCIYIYIYRERERERERGFCEWKNRNYAWNKRGNDILQYGDKNKKSKKQRKIKRQNNDNIESSVDMKS